MDHLQTIVKQLDTPEFGFKSEANIQHIIWKKAIANCVFNSVCPLLEADNGILYGMRRRLNLPEDHCRMCHDRES